MQRNREVIRHTETLPRESFGELLGDLAENSAALVRDEIQLVKQEMSEKARTLRSGIVVLAAGAIVGLLALMTLTAAAVIGLAKYVGPGYSALIIGATLLLIGGAVAASGMRGIKQTSLKPEQTIETLEEDKEWLKQLT